MGSSVAPRSYIEQMIPSENRPYGLGTFNLFWITGKRGFEGQAYGHLGATYGYQSVAAYFPEMKVAMALGTNIESDDQNQVFDAMCQAYNKVRGVLRGESVNCTFVQHGFYGGHCDCTSSRAAAR